MLKCVLPLWKAFHNGNYEKKLLMERNEVTANRVSGRGFISFHNI